MPFYANRVSCCLFFLRKIEVGIDFDLQFKKKNQKSVSNCVAIFVSVECGVTKGMLYKKQRKYTKEQQSGGDVRNCDLLEILNIGDSTFRIYGKSP